MNKFVYVDKNTDNDLKIFLIKNSLSKSITKSLSMKFTKNDSLNPVESFIRNRINSNLNTTDD